MRFEQRVDSRSARVSLWSKARPVRVPRDLLVNVCDDVVVTYVVRRERVT